MVAEAFLTAATLFSATLSCAGTMTACVVYIFYIRKRCSSFPLRLIFWLCGSDFFASISHFLGSTSLCLVVKNRRQTQKFELIFHLVAWLLPLASALVCWTFGALGPQTEPGSLEVPWCWITPNFPAFRWAFFYGPLVAIEVTLLVLYTAIVVRLGRSLRGAALRDEVLFAQLFFSAYIVAFVVLRLPSIARRLLQIFGASAAADRGALPVLHALCSPLTGFVNALLFLLYRPVFRALRFACFRFCARHWPACARACTLRAGELPTSCSARAALAQLCCCGCFPSELAGSESGLPTTVTGEIPPVAGGEPSSINPTTASPAVAALTRRRDMWRGGGTGGDEHCPLLNGANGPLSGSTAGTGNVARTQAEPAGWPEFAHDALLEPLLSSRRRPGSGGVEGTAEEAQSPWRQQGWLQPSGRDVALAGGEGGQQGTASASGRSDGWHSDGEGGPRQEDVASPPVLETSMGEGTPGSGCAPTGKPSCHVFVGSWNLAKRPPCEDLSTWLADARLADVVAIGFQEAPAQAPLFELIDRHLPEHVRVASPAMWQICTLVYARRTALTAPPPPANLLPADALIPATISSPSNAAAPPASSLGCPGAPTPALTTTSVTSPGLAPSLGASPPTGAPRRCGLVGAVSAGVEHAGLGRLLGNKGATAASLTFAEGLSLLFVNVHLPPFPPNIARRNACLAQILAGLATSMVPVGGQLWGGGSGGEGVAFHSTAWGGAPEDGAAEQDGFVLRPVMEPDATSAERALDVLPRYDAVFLLGDLNYCLDTTHQHVAKAISRWSALAQEGPIAASSTLAPLLASDQLRLEQRAGGLLSGFVEDTVFEHPPTYKLLAGRGPSRPWTYDRKRRPAWTDRILWHVLSPTWAPIHPLGPLRAAAAVTSSDHVPIAQSFAVAVRWPYVWRPHTVSNRDNHTADYHHGDGVERLAGREPGGAAAGDGGSGECGGLGAAAAALLGRRLTERRWLEVLVVVSDLRVTELEPLAPDGSADPFVKVFSNVSAAGFDTPPVRLSLAPSWPTCPVPLRIRLALAPACFAGDVCLSPGSLAVSCAQPDASSLALLLKDALTRVRVAFAVYDAGLLGSGEATLGQAVVSLAGAVRWSLASNAGGSGEGDPRGAIGATAPPRYRFSSALTRLGRRTGWLQGALQVYMLQI